MKISIFWARRDLRIEDNTALFKALSSGKKVLPIFIFDENIVNELPSNDSRISFIYSTLKELNNQLKKYDSSFFILKGNPIEVWKELIKKFDIAEVYINKDYEPYGIQRDASILSLLEANKITLHSYKDQVIFEEKEIVKNDGKPYTIFTPYKNKWLYHFQQKNIDIQDEVSYSSFHTFNYQFPSITELGFQYSEIKIQPFNLSKADNYSENRNIPSLDATSYLSPHLRFGTVSIRQIIRKLKPENEVFLSELIWREFFMQILFNFPKVIQENFKPKYNHIDWRNNKTEFEKWCKGKTGYPLVDAGMRQLNKTGYMHNRVRMVTAGFLCKHLLINWQWGEAYFAEKLLDYELSSNNGNWQWAAGTGCDAAPYFRIFNPIEQLKKFDNKHIYVKEWIPELETTSYPQPIVDHKFARIRALERYKNGIEKYTF
ncbi:MAG: deoxyribodipyrimidine photo-lyase [Flavobacteriaceae bacterium]|jgi:deoxyribodipyrimidine photo-lyase|uniref:cryptochrome/photolyase family protein n=1 Tax=Candidatus Marifrigoribacter sp. Uisw_064 TaxID=3230970 RepID=UPI003AE41F00